MATVAPGSGAPNIWFVVPVTPGVWSMVWSYLAGGHGTYTIVKTVQGNPLYDQYQAEGFPQYTSYAAAVAGARAITAQAKAHATLPYVPGGLTPGDAAAAQSISIGGFLGALSSKNLWIRVGEVVSGLILLGIGLNAMLKGKPLQVVTRTAGMAGKAAMLA